MSREIKTNKQTNKNNPHYHIFVGTIFKKTNYRDFPGGQWLRLCASNVGGTDSVYALQLSQNKKRKKTN